MRRLSKINWKRNQVKNFLLINKQQKIIYFSKWNKIKMKFQNKNKFYKLKN